MNSRQNKTWIGGVLLLISQVCWGTVFDLTPLGNLPSGVVPGETVYAYYTVYNKSTENLANNRLILPKNVVTQSTIPKPTPSTVTLCEAEPFYLGAKQSCVLKLAVTGAVNGDSEDSSQQIYVCLQDGLNCSGTSIKFNNTLNVENKNLQTAYVADQAYNTTGGVAACPVLNDGSLGAIADEKCSYANINFSAPTDVIINNNATPPAGPTHEKYLV